MSDTTAFLAGCAVSGVVALLLFKSGLCNDLPPFYPRRDQPDAPSGINPVPQNPSPPSAMAPGGNASSQLDNKLEQQKTNTQQLATQLELQKAATEHLKTELERQRLDTERLMLQLQEQQRTIVTLSAGQARPVPAPFQQQANFHSGILWAIGGMVIILVGIGGGIVIVCAIALLRQPQRSSGYTRTIEEPMNLPWPYTVPRGYTHFLPPPTNTRPMK